MDIGKPQRIRRVEPVKEPVPEKETPAPPPEKAPAEPVPVPAK
jgi:hypothetical protein